MPARCESCESDALTQISMTMRDGNVVDFASCHRCEHKTWRCAGTVVPLGDVLEIAARK